MSDHTPQSELSSLIDSELSGSEEQFLLRRLSHDAELQSTWQRYHLIGDVMRGTYQPLPESLVQRVRDALAEDATPHRDSGLAAWLKPAAGLGIAASVAFAVFSFLPEMEPTATPVVATESIDARPGLSAVAQPASSSSAPDRQLEQLIMRHNGAKRGGGLMPYVYIVSSAETPEAEREAEPAPSAPVEE